MESGIFITFEGPDGSGKTTQISLLAEQLKNKGFQVLLTREPGGTIISNKIREILLHPEHQEMMAETEILLYAASRAQHVREVIIPALQEGNIVLCDRFLDASIAYQGYGLGFGQKMIKEVNKIATGGLTPVRTYMMDISPEEGRSRMSLRQNQEFTQGLDRIEEKELTYHQRVREGFLSLAKQEERIILIDGNKPVADIQQQIVEDMLSWIDQVEQK